MQRTFNKIGQLNHKIMSNEETLKAEWNSAMQHLFNVKQSIPSLLHQFLCNNITLCQWELVRCCFKTLILAWPNYVQDHPELKKILAWLITGPSSIR